MTKFLDPQVVEIARSYLGTPFHHQGRVNSGLDCIGLIVIAYKQAGYDIKDYISYSSQPDEDEFMYYVTENCIRIEFEDAVDGDMVLFYIVQRNQKKKVQHCGILSNQCENIIHTWSQVARGNHQKGKVVESTLEGPWLKRMHSVWRVDPWRLSH